MIKIYVTVIFYFIYITIIHVSLNFNQNTNYRSLNATRLMVINLFQFKTPGFNFPKIFQKR